MTSTHGGGAAVKSKAKTPVAKKKSKLAKSSDQKAKVQVKKSAPTSSSKSNGKNQNQTAKAATPIKVTLGRSKRSPKKPQLEKEEAKEGKGKNGTKQSKDADADVTQKSTKQTTTPKASKRQAKQKQKTEPESADELSFENDKSEALADKATTPLSSNSKSTSTNNNNNNNNNVNISNDLVSSTSSSLIKEDDDRAACCLCHCALDYSDRAAFFQPDRQKEVEEHEHDNNNDSSEDDDDSVYYQLTDPYVPQNLYDPSNALVYCDGCNRLYHQKCHFVPLMVVPRGTWNCLVCTTAEETANSPLKGSNKKKTKASPATKKQQSQKVPFSKAQLKRMFQSPPPAAKQQQYLAEPENALVRNNQYHTPDEKEWEIVTRHDKASLWHKTLTQIAPGMISSAFGNFRQAETALETLTRTQQNRQHFLENSASSRGSQELAQTLVKMTGAKLKLRQIVMNLEQIRVNPERHIQLIQQWCDGITEPTAAPLSLSLPAAPIAASGNGVSNSNTATTRPPPRSFMERVVFPFGRYPPRSIPRTAEQEEIDKEQANALQPPETTVVKNGTTGIPKEIVTSTPAGVVSQSISASAKHKGEETKAKPEPKSSKSKKESKSTTAQVKDKKQKPSRKEDADAGSSSSSGISLDDLKCCICLIGDATDENDLLLCDGQGCYRAYHMHCLQPRVTLEEVEATEGEDWFCPLCTNLAECMHMIQSNFMGDDWDRRRLEREHAREVATKKQKKAAAKVDKDAENESENDDDDDSLKSWDQPTQVFPRAQWEYDAAMQLKAGNRNDETKALLELVLGDGDNEDGEGGRGNGLDNYDDGTDDEELDEHFDPTAFEAERRRQREEEMDAEKEDDDSSHSSQASLVDMSSVELNIGKDELNALSEGSDSDSDSDEEDGSGSEDESGDGQDSNKGKRRQSRRLRRKQNQEELPKNIGVDYDPANIVQGKRRRKHVDYKKLNEAMFGELDEAEIANIDDKEDFQVTIPTKRYSSSSSEDEDSESGESGSEEDSSGSKDENDPKDKKSGKKRVGARKRTRGSSDNEEDEGTDSGNEAGSEVSSVASGDAKKERSKKPPAKKNKKTPAPKAAKRETAKGTSKSKPKSKTARAQKNGVKKSNSKTSKAKAKAKPTAASKAGKRTK